jgi:hypothetical protein
MSPKSLAALLLIAAVLVAGAIALHIADTGQGARTSTTLSNRAASD